ncbi:FKBP-type peptidyl-prolyl cis-trans isomerase N-terminal domain-containing protein [uncultured Fibrobacter sp.]|uniref:FKBP-type peptidyl-prolyl cis-trans isomerase N-terminal domain-containing protein n=1 Tax=uncultured Fibrobacter sp. TaxID=261512 RepID=UPI0015634C97|nr:FKBP-type peptidyl-prolyl cis-trans isomerase N-terminal domain-containing protein [uncultured Fibrobacter sp.]
MKSQFIVLGACALALIACNSQDSKPAAISANSTDDQKFAYMIGTQFGTQNFTVVPVQSGEHIDQDCLIQAIFDNVKANKDTTFKIQLPVDSLSALAGRYNIKARNRLSKAQPDSAAVASFEGSQEKYRAYVDSVLKSFPIEPEPPVTGQPVVLGENPTENQKFSYLLGMQISNQLINIGAQFQTEFDAEYFVLGIKDAAAKVRDSNFVMPLPEDTLKAVGVRYNEKMKVLREEAMKKAQEEEAKLKEAVAGLRGDTLPNGMPVKMNFKVKVTGISTKDENLEAYAGKPLLISYFSATCGHCAHAAPQVVEMAKEFVPKGLTAVTVFSGGNNKPGIRKFTDNAGYDDNEKVVWDESRQFGELYSDGYVPKIYLVNPDGTYKQYAAFEKEKEDLKREIAELLDGKNVEWKVEPPAPATVDTLKPAAAPAPATK